jgi:hypothetical protein
VVDEKDINKNIMLSIKNKKNAPVIVDDFDFGRMPSGNLLDD